jgi:hypothetical protein
VHLIEILHGILIIARHSLESLECLEGLLGGGERAMADWGDWELPGLPGRLGGRLLGKTGGIP